MKRVLYGFCFITLNLYLTACGSGGGGGSEAKSTPVDGSNPSITQPGVTTPSTFDLTYYTLVKNATVSQGGNSYSVTYTGHCVVYESSDYCWDDGWQTIPAINYSNSFWQLCKINGVVGQCHGGGSTDPVADTPTLWSQMAAKLPTPPYQPSDIYTQGIATQVSCSENGGVIDCTDFQIDTAQASL